MALTPEELQNLRAYPPDSIAEVDQAVERSFKDEMIQRVGNLPYDGSASPNEFIGYNSTGSGLLPAGDNANPGSFGGGRVAFWRPYGRTISLSTSLTEKLDLGCKVRFNNVNPITITIDLSGNPLTGVTDDFFCVLLRLFGSNEVQLALGSGLTNRHPSGHTRIGVQQAVSVHVIGSGVYIDGATEP